MPASRILFSLPCRTPVNPPEVALAAVASAADLPAFLIAGRLDRASFQATSSGWHATWRNHSAEIAFTLDWRHDRSEASFEATAPGIDPLFGVATGSTLATVLRHLAPPLPRWLQSAMKSQLEAIANLRVLTLDAPEIVTIPSGPLTVLAVPLPLDWLDEFVDWHRSAQLDNRLGTRCPVHVCECDSRIDYRDRKHIPQQTNRGLAQIFADATGHAVDIRAREQADGRIALDVQRRCTLALFVVPFFAIPQLVELLLAERFLPSADFAAMAAWRGPFGVESAALLLPPLAFERLSAVIIDEPARNLSVAYSLGGIGNLLDPTIRTACQPPEVDDPPLRRHDAPPGIVADADGTLRLGRLDDDGVLLAEVTDLWLNDEHAVDGDEEGPGPLCTVSRRRP
jgi:hypothetical protein